jgi:hypothetical protein
MVCALRAGHCSSRIPMNFVHRDPGSILCPRGPHGCRSLSLASALSRAAPVETVEDQRSPGSRVAVHGDRVRAGAADQCDQCDQSDQSDLCGQCDIAVPTLVVTGAIAPSARDSTGPSDRGGSESGRGAASQPVTPLHDVGHPNQVPPQHSVPGVMHPEATTPTTTASTATRIARIARIARIRTSPRAEANVTRRSHRRRRTSRAQKSTGDHRGGRHAVRVGMVGGTLRHESVATVVRAQTESRCCGC